MPIVAAGILSNNPLLLPGLSDEAHGLVTKTNQAATKLGKKIAEHKPDIILFITTIKQSNPTVGFSFLQQPNFPYEFNELGDLITNGTARGAIGFVHRLKEHLETSFPIPLITQKRLPFNFAIPLVSLGQTLNEIPLAALIIPNSPTPDQLQKLARALNEELSVSAEKIALIVAGDLAETNKKYASEAKIFNQHFNTACQSTQPAQELINLQEGLRQNTNESLWASTTLLYLTLGEKKSTTEILSYETQANTGLLVAYIGLN